MSATIWIWTRHGLIAPNGVRDRDWTEMGLAQQQLRVRNAQSTHKDNEFTGVGRGVQSG